MISNSRVPALFLMLFVASSSFAQLRLYKKRRQITHLNAIKRDFVPFKKRQYGSLGITINSLNYYGDLSPASRRISTDLRYTRPGLGIAYALRKGPRLTLQSQFLSGSIRGSDARSAGLDESSGIYRTRRNASFKNNIQELSVSAMFDLFENTGMYTHRVPLTPYAFLGAGIFHHNPLGQVPAHDLQGNAFPNAGQYVPLRPLGTEGQYAELKPGDANFGIKPYKLIQASLLFGFGMRCRIDEVMDLWVDLSLRYTFTDYLDDVSRNYVDLGVLSSELAKAMSYRTNDSKASPYNVSSYVGRDGKTYTVENGYGSEYPTNNRGSKNDRDAMMITSVRVSRIIGKSFHKAKSR